MSPTKKKSSKSGKKRTAAGTKAKAKSTRAAASATADSTPQPSGFEAVPAESIPQIQDGDVSRDQLSGRPRKIRGDFDLPQTAAGMSADESGNIAPAVRAFLQANADQTGMRADESSLKVVQEVSTEINRVVHFQQMHEGIPVIDTSVVVQVDDANRVRQIDLGNASTTVFEKAGDERKMTAKQAVASATAAVGAATLRQPVNDPSEVYFPTDAGLKLAYQVLILTREPPHDWRVIVDAYSGQILEQKDLLFHVDGQGFVFDPNPVVTANNNTLRDPTATAGTCGFAGTPVATIDAQRVTRTLKGLTLANGVHKLEGPFVKMRNFGAPNINPPTEANANNFKYSSGDNRFEAVNVYYHVDTTQRFIQSLGITTAHNKVIECDAHDGVGGGAFFSPGDGGLHFGDSGACLPNRASDGDVMLHEYGHAIQNNQVPGWGGTNPVTHRAETRAMGEGFGDILACLAFAERGGGFQREFFEDWIFGSTPLKCLRRVDGTKVYPTDWHNEEHDDGEIWSAALWNIYRTIGGDSMNAATRTAAANALLKTVILSHHSVAANATMPDGAEAVMNTNAALPEFLGKHLIQMLNSFHDRGLLRSNAGVDLWIKDDPADTGANVFGGTFWNSPDLWIRNANDNGTTHQAPEFGQDNWFYARVRNRGTQTARAFVVTFNVKPFAGTQFVYPGDWIPFISAAVGYNLAPGASTIVKAKWPKALVPPVGTHACWLASAYTPVDPIPSGKHVWEYNNLAQKNLAIVNAIPGDSLNFAFQVGSQFLQAAEKFTLEVQRASKFSTLPISIFAKDPKIFAASVIRDAGDGEEAEATPVAVAPPPPTIRFLDPARVEITQGTSRAVRMNLGRGSTLDLDTTLGEEKAADVDFEEEMQDVKPVTDANGISTVAIKAGILGRVPITLLPRSPVEVGMKFQVPATAKVGEAIDVDVVQRDSKNNIVGGVTMQVMVGKKK
jgi:Fungalysin metallopeptidase (M36)/Peptidase propeptide and YPEB domain/Fungalysin/Thermolysin Propeptide Motif